MRFMMLVKSKEALCTAPPKEFMEAMQKLMQDTAQTAKMLDSGGLSPIASATRVRLEDGQIRVIDGPFAETKEVVGGYAQFEFKTKEEAIESTRRFMDLHRLHWPGWEGETEIRQIVGPEDLPPNSCH